MSRKPQYACRIDGNHADIRTEFRRLMGLENVVDTSRFGSPFGDLMLKRGHLIRSIETKYRSGGLTKAQEKETLPFVLVREVKDCAGVVATLEQDFEDVCEGRKKRLGHSGGE